MWTVQDDQNAKTSSAYQPAGIPPNAIWTLGAQTLNLKPNLGLLQAESDFGVLYLREQRPMECEGLYPVLVLNLVQGCFVDATVLPLSQPCICF